MRRARRSEAGLTLVELLVSIVILSMITGALSSVFVTALNGSRPTNERVRESNDAQLIAAYLVRDAQSAGGTNPGLGKLDSELGVSAPSRPGYCNSSAGTVIVRFAWRDRSSLIAAPLHEAYYYYDAAQHQVFRETCVDGARESVLTLGGSVAAILPNGVAQCITGANPPTDCPPAPTLPDVVELSVRATTDPANPSPTAYTYKLTASLRPEGQNAPDSSNSTLTPLIALGTTCGDGVTGLQTAGSGNSTVTVYGATAVNGGCPPVNFQGSIDFVSTGGISVLAGPPPAGTCVGTSSPCSTYSTPIGDPFATLTPPAADCTNGTHPAQNGNTYYPGVYQSPLAVGDATFSPGTYVFCAGLTTNGFVDATGVLFYFTGGTLTINDGTFRATAQTIGPYGSGTDGANIVVWQQASDITPISVCCSDDTIAVFRGTVYAPGASFQLHNTNISVTSSVVAAAVEWPSGRAGGTTIIGRAPPSPLAMTGPASLQGWTVNVPYPSVTATASGGAGGNIWTATGLPPGMTFTPAGVLKSTPVPTVAGTYSVTLTVTDSIGETDSRTYLLSINAVPTVSGPPLLTDWTINRDYPGTAMIATAGTTPYQWSAAGLPAGLVIDASTGVITGTPTATATSTPTIKLVDASGVSATRGYTMKINNPPRITGPATMPNWTAGQSGYPDPNCANGNGNCNSGLQMTWVDGTAPFTWAASGLPTGLTINGNGVISGTPTTAGTFSVSVTLTDKAGASSTQNYSVTINPAVGITTPRLPNAEVGKAYNFQLTPSGGTPPFTWSLRSNPFPWLTIDASTGVLSGTPTATDAQNVRVRVRDSTGNRVDKTYTLTVAAGVQISGPATLPNWTINRDYPGTAIIVSGGVAPFTWTATGLPAGLSLNPNTGVITGTPTALGTSTITVTVRDAYSVTDPQSYTVTINPSPLISTSSLPNGERSVFYSTTIATTNGTGTPPFKWAGSGLPNGLSINAATGVLSGTPTVFGTFELTITVTDVAGASNSRKLILTLNDTPTVNAGTLPDWTRGRVYPDPQITGSGGTAPYTFTVSAGTLPAGLALDANTGVISGTPTATGTRSFTVRIRDSLGPTATQTFSITINLPPTITTLPILPVGEVGTPYPGATITSSGGTAPLGWSATGLPPGLSIDAATGVISGTPTAAGTFPASITVTDNAGAADTRVLPIVINPAPAIANVQLQNSGTAGTIEQGDTIVVTFSAAMSVSSICSTWSNDANDQSLSADGDVTITFTDGTGVTNDSLTVTSASCSFNFGSIDLGDPGYIAGGDATFTGSGANASSITWTAASHTLTITLGSGAGGTLAAVASSTPVYTAGPIVDPVGGTLSNSPFTLGAGAQF